MKLWIWILIAAAAGALITWFVMSGKSKTVNVAIGATAGH